jgi:hypothetical protein
MAFDPSIGRATQFRKGQSGNAGGRPKSRLLSEALRNRLAQTVDHDSTGRTFAEAIADNLVRIACSPGPSAVHAANEIADRIEGRSPQSIQISDLAADLQSRSDEELEFYLANNRWPSDEELLLLRQPVEPTEM